MKKYTVSKNEAEQRLDKYITKKFPEMPMSLMYKAIRKKDIKINGKRCEISTRLKEGDEISFYVDDAVLKEKKAYENDIYSITPSLNIVYEDDCILLVDKAPGVSVHPDETDYKSSLITNIQAYLYLKGEYDPKSKETFTPSLCNRIDKNTGGIVIAAKTAMALREMNKKIKDREITKKYLCIVHGKLYPKEATLKAYHIKNSRQNRAYIFDEPQPDAREIITKYKVLKSKNNLTLVEVTLLTGRTHQIRAHFAHIGHPLAGDTKYGTNAMNKDLPYKYQALYSYKIKFDFQKQSPLNYLKGKEFTVRELPDFAKNF